ncbi:MAG: YbaB/EbfC family nucleoid-associated protein [Clostridia bacterium]|nr:YbaB/EbfC family nucleoid-associated protein [Clostridia bacterium]
MARGGFPRNMGMGGMGNMNNMIKQAQKMQEEMLKAQEALNEQIFEASVGGGAVNVKANGKKDILEIKISPDSVDPDDVEMLEDMLVSAVNEVIRKADEAQANNLKGLTGGMSIPGLF